MTALIIIGAVILLLAGLAVVPVIVDLSYRDGEFQARLRYLVLRYSPGLGAADTGGKEKEKKKKKKKKKRPKKTGKETPEKAGTTMETVKLVRLVLKGSRKGAHILRRRLIFSRIRVRVAVGGEDAHIIAETTGKLNVAALAALDLIGGLFVLRPPVVEIAPDFLSTQSKYDLSLRVSIRTVHILRAGIRVFFKFMSALRQDKKTKQEIKGGKQHEPTTSNQ